MTTPDPRDEQRLRDLLDEATSDVEPRHGLDALLSRTRTPHQETPMTRRPWLLGSAAAVLATAATVTAVALTADGGAPTPGPADDPTVAAQSPVTEEPTGSPASEEPASGEPAPEQPEGPVAIEGAVPVYYLGDTGAGPRLYREFHPGIGAAPLDQAVADAVGRAPDDPDYRTPWPAGTTVQASLGGAGRISLVLTPPAGTDLTRRPAGLSKQEAELAVQQLVWTAQAATQTTAPVSVTVGDQATSLLGVPVGEPLTRGPEAETLAQVWIIEPAQGASVADGFEVSGVGSFFEANVVWELRRGGADGPVVASSKDAPVTAETAFEMAPYSFRVELPDDAAPGDYTLRVHDQDVSSGEGFAPFEDTKTLTLTD